MKSIDNFYLYTTSLQIKNNIKPNNILLLGNWCLSPYAINDSDLNKKKITNHRWNNNYIHEQDYIKIDELYEKYLPIISQKLNSFHNINEDVNYWRILIGPWLIYMCLILYERFHVVEDAFNNYKINNCLKFKRDYILNPFVANDMEDFNKIIENDFWNQHIYSTIIDFILPENNFDEIEQPHKIIFNTPKISFKSKLYQLIFKLFNFFNKIFFSFFIKKNNYVYLGTYLGYKNLIILYLKTRQFPLFEKINKPKLGYINIEKRKNITIEISCNNKFELFFSKSVFQYIPIVFFENFKYLKKEATSLLLPSFPKIIFTSNLLYHKTLFMIYVAEKVKIGTKLIIAQHGGMYFTSKHHRGESHELKIANKYLSWGSITNNCKVLNIGIIKNINNINYNKNSNKIFLVLNSIPQYVCNLNTDIIAVKFDTYIKDCLYISRVVTSRLMNNMKLFIRPYFHDFGWNEKQILKNSISDIFFDSTSVDIWKIASQSRLIIFSYNSTGFLELIASKKVPVILILNMEVDQIRDDVKPYFEELGEVGIFHSDIKSFEIHLSKIINNVEIWWESQEVQNKLDKFNTKFAYNNQNLINEIVQNIEFI